MSRIAGVPRAQEVVDRAEELDLDIYGLVAAVVEGADEPLEELGESRFAQGEHCGGGTGPARPEW
ncbi:hypothetical protein ACI2L1_24295 [Streptomyces sp. NPDC019531]|uniref:hypothetical protein n=1 Tax=Streptomyces sp. NPDC019531 TaxID=3365062 RepID=UPI00384D0279